MVDSFFMVYLYVKKIWQEAVEWYLYNGNRYHQINLVWISTHYITNVKQLHKLQNELRNLHVYYILYIHTYIRIITLLSAYVVWRPLHSFPFVSVLCNSFKHFLKFVYPSSLQHFTLLHTPFHTPPLILFYIYY